MQGSTAILLSLVLSFSISSCNLLSGYTEGRSSDMLSLEDRYPDHPDMGMMRFTFDDLGGLNSDTLQTNAVPWKVIAATLLLENSADKQLPPNLEGLDQLLQQFGFIRPESVKNWRGTPQPEFKRPLGMVNGYLERDLPKFRVEVMNLGCAACHAGVTYDRHGLPTREVWLGLPNSSLNLDAYINTVFNSLKQSIRSPEVLLETIKYIFPDADPNEMYTLKTVVLPKIAQRLSALEAAPPDDPLPFKNGGPGNTNGVASLKFQLNLLGPNRPSAKGEFTSIPELGGRLLRSSLLYDGVYAPPGQDRFHPVRIQEISRKHIAQMAPIVAFFTVPSMGVKPDAAGKIIPKVEEILGFLQSYKSPQFPATLDPPLALKGREIYHNNCAHCHGSYSPGINNVTLLSFPNRLIPQAEMRTDPARWQAVDEALLAAVGQLRYSHFLDARNTGGYVAPPLSGIWATAPYLHNGSVPTLWHLMHPEARPSRFYVGGHMLDYSKIGIAGAIDAEGTLRYPAEYKPWATPVLYDTTQPGRSNTGHETEFKTLTDADKEALLEYLKLL